MFFIVYFNVGGKESRCDSYLTPEMLQMTAAELQNFTDQMKQGRNPNITYVFWSVGIFFEINYMLTWLEGEHEQN